MSKPRLMPVSEAIAHCRTLAEEADDRAGDRFTSDDSRAIHSVLAELSETRGSVAMLAAQLADKREIIRRLTT